MTKPKGVGDLVKKVTDAIGIEQCENCKDKQSFLNFHFPFTKPRLLTSNELEIVKSTKPKDADLLKIYNDAFSQELDENHFKENIKKSVIEKLNKLASYVAE